MAEQSDDDAPRQAQPRGETGFARKAHARLLDHHVAHVERIAERQKADDQQHVGLVGWGGGGGGWGRAGEGVMAAGGWWGCRRADAVRASRRSVRGVDTIGYRLG